ncbi:hypothetical protein [Haloprofundus salinisoli]|uniref:hypothetical protein n=1 Tax=Haloprofundus salinisoli TaxID=2876193 RepID=UPI001CC9082F|nr:hypothetical protein [Haloprofundus salinisoli]
MARELAVNDTEEESTTDGDNDGLLLGRRSYLQMAGAAAAAAATGAGASGVASAAVSENNYNTVVNIAEAGADTSGNRTINSVLEDHLQNNTLVKFPKGTYKLAPFSKSGLKNFAMVAPNGATIVPDHSGGTTLISLSRAQGVHIEGFDVEQPGSTSSRVVFKATSGTNVLKNWRLLDRQDAGSEVGGAFLQCAGSDTVLTLENVDFSKGGLGMGVWVRPTIVGDYPDVGEVPELDPAGTLNFVNCDVSRWDHEGLYASAHSGPVNVIGGRYANSNIQQIRTGGPKAVVKGAEVVCDDKSHTPRDRNARGIWMKEGHEMLIEDCDIIMSDVGASSGAIVHGTEGGKMTVRNTRIKIDDNVKALKSRSPKSWPFRAVSMDSAPSSRRLVMENVSVTGTASGDEAILIYGRDGSELRNLCVEQNGSNQNGIQINGSSNVTLRDSTINVTGQATVFNSSNVNTANVSGSESCPTPNFDGRPVEYDGNTGGSTNESGLPNHVEVTGDGNYAFAASGEIKNAGKANLEKEDSIEAQTASGTVVNGGTDSYGFEGELNALDADDGVTVKLNGEAVNAADYPSVSRPNVIAISGDNGLASYEFTVDGELGVGPASAGTFNEEDNIHGATAEGATAGGRDAYSFSGNITQFRFTEGTATVYVNGQEVDPSELGSDTTDGGSTDDGSSDGSTDDGSTDDGSEEEGRGDTGGEEEVERDSDHPHLLVINGPSEGVTNYSVAVTGEIKHTDIVGTVDAEDEANGNKASGAVAGGIDAYLFSGDITQFNLSGSASVDLKKDYQQE